MLGGLTRIAAPAAAVAALGIEGDDPRVVEVAEGIRAAQAPEIEQLDAMLDAWGQDRGSADVGRGSHGGTGEGMMSPADLEALECAEGAELVRLAEAIVRDQRAEIDAMRAPLDRL
ncbi:DUF305 domain-containing protein [Agrococcus sp. Marseille-Q4369]|uniref:DUF305 domain-containing protein n=1 Tax=Agrococcus sp. Marseille-Q4369 TaxID=2810513 RepID=UPI001B8C32FF|nr:DUF305 domain-containing protein [Agrococcus sp. Marseille-Q4369]QUW18082.1 DUF305 domain-containing protein [Agrococcus sp. Marseille-Q4369]